MNLRALCFAARLQQEVAHEKANLICCRITVDSCEKSCTHMNGHGPSTPCFFIPDLWSLVFLHPWLEIGRWKYRIGGIFYGSTPPPRESRFTVKSPKWPPGGNTQPIEKDRAIYNPIWRHFSRNPAFLFKDDGCLAFTYKTVWIWVSVSPGFSAHRIQVISKWNLWWNWNGNATESHQEIVAFPKTPGKLTWNLKISPCKWRNIYKPPIFGCHVSFRGCSK